jgi:tetratricopeptide (TPR) repeat protein
MARSAIGSGLVCVSVGLAASLLAAPARSASDPRTERAREHYLQADAFYKLDRYANALQEYEQAYLAKPDPSFLYNIAQCHRLMGDKAEAIKFYRRYLQDAPNAPNREVAEKHIKDLEAALAAAPVAPVAAPAAPVAAPAAPAPVSAAAGSPAAPAWTPAPAASAVPSMPPAVETVSPMPAPRPVPPTANPTALALAAPPPAGATEPSGGALAVAPPPSRQDQESPIYTKWWFWTGIGAVLAGGLIIALSAKSDPSCPAGRTCQ